MKHAYFDCICDSTEHTIRFSWFEDEDSDYGCVYMDTTLHQYRSIWKRCWVALKYVFGYECKYGHWDSTTFSQEKTRELGEWLIARADSK